MNVAGIDFSTHAVDIVLIDLDDTAPPVWHRYELVGNDAFDRARTIRGNVPGPWSGYWDDVLAVGIEQPQMRGSGMATAYGLYRIQGAILFCIPQTTLVQPWLPASWRKTVGIPGNAKKDVVAHWAESNGATPLGHWDDIAPGQQEFRMPPQDACDAYCIAVATRTAITLEAAA